MTENFEIQTDDFLYGLAVFNQALSDGDELLFGARASGLYHSVDGLSWLPAMQSLVDQAYSATAVAIGPGRTSDESVFVGLSGGSLYTRDGGKSWFSGKMPSPPPVIACMAVSPNYLQDGIILAGSMEDGVLRSADRGQNWYAWNFGLLDLGVMCLAISPDFVEDETVFAGTESSLFRSTNGGRAWREVELPSGYDPIISLACSPDFSQQPGRAGVVFAGTESQGLYRSLDRGKSWKRVGEGLLEGIIQNLVLAQSNTNTMIGSLDCLAVADGKVFLSRDQGDTWRPVWEDHTLQQPAVMVLANRGLEPGASAWVGFANGRAARAILP
jgi:photosystem II stability/assembly factor-like uncharacterized protein